MEEAKLDFELPDELSRDSAYLVNNKGEVWQRTNEGHGNLENTGFRVQNPPKKFTWIIPGGVNKVRAFRG